MKNIATLLFTLAIAVSSFAQSPIGTWKTIDDETGEAKSHVEIYEQGGKLYGKVVQLLLVSPDKKCDKCPGDKKDKPIVGMVIVENLQAYKDYWRSGTIMDPKTGKEYGCSIWFEEGQKDQLQVRGKHWTGLYRTQIWHRVP